MPKTVLPVHSGSLLGLASSLLLPTLAHGWQREEHSHITATATQLLPAQESAMIAPEAAALAREYCMFPDHNWPGYGQWGSGVADPRKPRFPDTRREWDISFYTGWNPVTKVGKSYVHRPPESYEAVPRYFGQAIEAMREGRLEDAARYLGVTLHYLQDSGAFGHLQPIHRVFHWKNRADVAPDGYTPQILGQTPETAAAGLLARLQELVRFTEEHTDKVLMKAPITMAEIKRLCGKELMPPTAVLAVNKVRRTNLDEWDAVIRECATECVHVSADALRTALAFAPKSWPVVKPHVPGSNLAFNSSFEAPGDGSPEGWCVGWLDLEDRAGRAEWYLAGTHWEKPVRKGERSLLVLWAPQSGIEWRPTWRHAVRVQPGQSYSAAAWVKTSTDSGAATVSLEYYDAAYLPVKRLTSTALTGDTDWQQLAVTAAAPENARWLRLILHSNADGAAWFDEVELTPAE